MIASRTQIQDQTPGDAKARRRWGATYASSQRFYHVRFRLLAAALPPETENLLANAVTPARGELVKKTTPIIIDSNPHSFGVTAAFTPKAIVIAGGSRRRMLLSKGQVHATGWVGEQALEAMGIKASDGISSDELQQKLQQALINKFANRKGQSTGNAGDSMSSYPYDISCYIVQVYPFDNEVIFNLRGDRFRLSYDINTETREVTLTGVPVEVEQEYVDVQSCGGLAGFDSMSKLPYVPLGVRVDSGMAFPAFFGVSYGAPNSEMRNPMFGEPFLNVDKVVAVYQANIKNGYHSPILPPAAPIPGVRMLFANELRQRGVVSPADFFAWVQANKDKPLDAGPAGADDWAHAPGDDKSKWKLPIHNKTHVRQAMSNFDDAKIPQSGKQAAVKKIVKRAGKFGIDSDSFVKSQGLTLDTDLDAETHEHHAGEFSVGDKAHFHTTTGAKVRVKVTGKTADGYKLKVASDKHKQYGYPKGKEFEHNGLHLTHVKASIQAGGPGSGRYPKGSSEGDDAPKADPPAQHESGSPNKSGPTEIHNEEHHDPAPSGKMGYGDGQTDEYGIKHNNADRDAVLEELRKQGFTQEKLDPVVAGRDIYRLSKPSTQPGGLSHSITVRGDGSFTHSNDPFRTDNGKGVDHVKAFERAGVFEGSGDAGWTVGGVTALRAVLRAMGIIKKPKSLAARLLKRR